MLLRGTVLHSYEALYLHSQMDVYYQCFNKYELGEKSTLEMIKYFMSLGYCEKSKIVVETAVFVGYTDCVKYLCENGFYIPPDVLNHLDYGFYVCGEIIETVKYLHERGAILTKKIYSVVAIHEPESLGYFHGKGIHYEEHELSCEESYDEDYEDESD